jgi:hypothetical protein
MRGWEMRIPFIGASSAQQYPDHHINMVVPFTALEPVIADITPR